MTMSSPFKRKQPCLTGGTVGDSGFGQMLQGGANRTMQLDARTDFHLPETFSGGCGRVRGLRFSAFNGPGISRQTLQTCRLRR
jgi:hypothetical protein